MEIKIETPTGLRVSVVLSLSEEQFAVNLSGTKSEQPLRPLRQAQIQQQQVTPAVRAVVGVVGPKTTETLKAPVVAKATIQPAEKKASIVVPLASRQPKASPVADDLKNMDWTKYKLRHATRTLNDCPLCHEPIEKDDLYRDTVGMPNKRAHNRCVDKLLGAVTDANSGVAH